MSEAACKTCDIGKYNDEIAQSSCKGCEKGYVSASGSSSVDACQLCPMGWLGEGKAQGCARCPVGKWSSDFWDGKVASECASSYIGVIVSGTCLSHGGSIPVSLSADECIGYGNDTSDYKSNKVLESRNINLLRKNADELLKQYQKLDKEIILSSKVKSIKVNIHKKNLLEKEKERIRILYVKIRKRIINIASNGNE